jgi:hypothetical protein
MGTCPKCGQDVSLWSAHLVSGLCRKCREARAAHVTRENMLLSEGLRGRAGAMRARDPARSTGAALVG